MALTGFMVGGVCATTSDAAMLALGSGYPYFLGSSPPVMCALSDQSYIAPSTFSQTITCHDLTSAKQDNFVHPITLQMCDPALDPSQFVTPTAAQILYVFSWGFGAIVFFFFLGFVIGIVAKVIKSA